MYRTKKNFSVSIGCTLLLHSATVFAHPENVRKAFCLDRIRWMTSEYEATKAFNSCYANADKLIDQYEKNKQEEAQKRETQRREWEREAKERERLRTLEVKKKEEEAQRIEFENKKNLKAIQDNPFSVFSK